MTVTTSSLLSNAHSLAQELAELESSQFTPVTPPPDSFMIHRPNRLSESYDHGQGVADILARWGAGPALQVAGLLHSFVCKGALSLDRVEQECGQRVTFLCQKYQEILHQPPTGQPRGNLHAFKRVKLYIAAYCDPDLAFLGVANLWDHFELARQSKPLILRAFSYQVQEVLIPTLTMLGMWELKEEAEEWVMRHGRNRNDYQFLVKRLVQTEEPRTKTFELVKQKLQPVLPHATLARKIRTPAQIYAPQYPEKTHPESLQKLIVDVLVDTEDEVYAALRWIHQFWKPVEGGLIDCIGNSDLNGYRCLRTAVIFYMDSGHIRVHFHIRTKEMDEINQWGLAAIELRDRYQTDLPHAWWSRREEMYTKIRSASLGSLPEILYVFSPQGQVFELHRGSTVVDYAYLVHSAVGHQCKRFKVNGEVGPYTTVLRHLDLVELERDPQFTGPTRAWLNAAHTGRARAHIKQFLKRQGPGSQHGQTVFDRHLQALKAYYRIDIPDFQVQQALNQTTRQFKFETRQDLLAEIAAGRFASDVIIHPLFAQEILRLVELPAELPLYPHQLSLAQCCKPRPGDSIVGRPRYREGEVIRLKVHQAACPKIADERKNVPLTWRLQPRLNTALRLEITALQEPHLPKEILQIIHQGLPDIVLHQMDFVSRNGVARMDFTIEAKNQDLIDRIAQNIEQLPGRTIKEVRQMQLLSAEREELIRPTAPTTTFNPYRRLPVRDRDMFFGRAEELEHIFDLLGTGIIFVRGQKRVGKTSFLLYLKEHYLEPASAVPVFIDFQLLGKLASPTFFYEIAYAVYNQLQTDDQLIDIGPPIRELFQATPSARLADYLNNVQNQLNNATLVLLIDEFSRAIDAYRQGHLNEAFFQQWRGVLQTTMPMVSYVMVVQQQTHDALLKHTRQRNLDPIWHLLEMGEMLTLQPLSEKDARQLIEQPTHNYLDYAPEAAEYVWRLTGGSPFLIQAFCYNLVRHMARDNRRRVEWVDVDTVQNAFMNPDEGVFAHLVDMITLKARPVCQQLSQFVDDADHPVPLAEIREALPDMPPAQLINAIQELTDHHILIRSEPNSFQFTSLLFGRWLSRHTILEQLGQRR